jgi:Cu+-exporting ATPase
MTAPEEQHGVARADLIRIALIAAVAAATWFRLWRPLPQVDILAIAAMIAGGWPIWREALEAVTRRRMTMELSMSIAIFAAAIIGESFTALIIVGFVLIAEILEHFTVGRGRKAIGRLVALLPRTALVRRGGSEEEIDVHAIARATTWSSSGRAPAFPSTAKSCVAAPGSTSRR